VLEAYPYVLSVVKVETILKSLQLNAVLEMVMAGGGVLGLAIYSAPHLMVSVGCVWAIVTGVVVAESVVCGDYCLCHAREIGRGWRGDFYGMAAGFVNRTDHAFCVWEVACGSQIDQMRESGGAVVRWGHSCRYLGVVVWDTRRRRIETVSEEILSHVGHGDRSHDHRRRHHLYLVRAHCALVLLRAQSSAPAPALPPAA
jgi:hypothetical protein